MAKLICASCNQRITGRYTQALGKNWHPDCFRCAACGELIESSGFLVKSGKPYHPACYHKKYAPRCAACGELITGNFIRAFRKCWHPEHFICEHCEKPINGNFFAHEGKPYCEKDYVQLFAEKCSKCGAVLSSKYFVDIWGNKYCAIHRKEPRCSSCDHFIGTSEAPGGVKYADGRVVCNTCHKTALNEKFEAYQLMENIQKVLAKYAFHFDKKLKIPIELTGQKELHAVIRSKSREMNTAGVTHTRVHAFLGMESSREVEMIEILYGLPYEHAGAVLAHELGHVWLFLNHYPQLPRHIEEGICEWISSLWLESQNTELAKTRLLMLEKNPNQVYGRGYRAMKKAVKNNPPSFVLDYIKRNSTLPGK